MVLLNPSGHQLDLVIVAADSVKSKGPDQQRFDLEVEKARKAFGEAIRVWFKVNRWSQSVPQEFGKALGNQSCCWNAQISQLMSGSISPTMGFWLNLEQFNQAIADRTWVNCITDDNLIPCLNRALPFTDANGDPADAISFFSMFLGRAKWSKIWAPNFVSSESHELKQEAFNTGLLMQRMIRKLQLDLSLRTPELWELIVDTGHFGELELEGFKEFFLGMRDYTPGLHGLFTGPANRALADVSSLYAKAS